MRHDEAREIIQQLLSGKRRRVPFAPMLVAGVSDFVWSTQDGPYLSVYGMHGNTENAGIDHVVLFPKTADQLGRGFGADHWWRSAREAGTVSIDNFEDESIAQAIEMLCAWSDAATWNVRPSR